MSGNTRVKPGLTCIVLSNGSDSELGYGVLKRLRQNKTFPLEFIPCDGCQYIYLYASVFTLQKMANLFLKLGFMIFVLFRSVRFLYS